MSRAPAKRMLIVSTYPAIRPQHGGQKRTLAIANAYRAVGFEVMHSAVFCRSHYPAWATSDIPLSTQFERRIRSNPLIGDLICGEAVTQDDAVRRSVQQLLLGFRPDVVHVEQPHLYPGYRTHLSLLRQRPILVYGSQNVEAPMKRAMLLGYGMPARRADALHDELHRLEQTFSRECDLLAACTPTDLAHHRRLGARRGVLAPNGVERSPAVGETGLHDLDVAERIADAKLVVFIGSAHPPNLTGYRELLGDDIGFLPSDTELVVIGGVCQLVRPYLKQTKSARAGKRQPILAGVVTERQLSALLERAEVIVLPITSGGGSNLKSAEAIAADRKVVATTHALRSFEWFSKFPNVWMADQQADFQAAIVQALAAQRVSRTPSEQAQAASVFWDQCLADLVEAVNRLVAKRR